MVIMMLYIKDTRNRGQHYGITEKTAACNAHIPYDPWFKSQLFHF